MLIQVSNGWTVLFPKGFEFDVSDAKKKRALPTGIYVHRDGGPNAYIDFAGEGAQVSSLRIPNEPEILRDLARALSNLADDVENARGGIPRR